MRLDGRSRGRPSPRRPAEAPPCSRWRHSGLCPICRRRGGPQEKLSCPKKFIMFDTSKRSNASAGWTRGYDLIMASDPTLTVCSDPAALAETAANLIIDAATEAVRERGRFMLCLAGGETPRKTYALLALGVDGHTASLFPGSPVLREVFRTVAAVHVAAAQIPQRLTLTFPVLNAAARVIFLVAGAEKAKIVKAVLSDQAVLPAAMVRPTDGELIWLADRAAAALHPIGGAR